ncbi:hypothetical protein ACS5PU_07330 [Pedobacter sp. GSP4]|uniref:hypothetical protein n=1 Tax=Pedobacter sp. GSP4 TaxID=3453716 RepID=UPI003EEBE9C7
MNNFSVKMGIVGGVCFSVLGQWPIGILQTILLATLGAVVSFIVSRILQRWFKDD